VEKVNSRVDAGEERREILQLNGEREDVRVGRRFLGQTLIQLGWEDRLDDASLLLSELLANVTLHARTGCSVVVNTTADRLCIEVEDRSPVMPRVHHYSIDTTTGRGLRLVDRLAESWGTEPTPEGKRVWFCLDHGSPASGVETRGEIVVTGQEEGSAVPDLDDLLHRLGTSEQDDSPFLRSSLEPAT
jgi:anti-sigma regulatory factor (Ser/Thr protein kinase)